MNKLAFQTQDRGSLIRVYLWDETEANVGRPGGRFYSYRSLDKMDKLRQPPVDRKGGNPDDASAEANIGGGRFYSHRAIGNLYIYIIYMSKRTFYIYIIKKIS